MRSQQAVCRRKSCGDGAPAPGWFASGQPASQDRPARLGPEAGRGRGAARTPGPAGDGLLDCVQVSEPRRVRAWALAALILLTLIWAFQSLSGYAAREVSRRIQETADRLGLQARFDGIQIGLLPALELTGMVVEKAGVFSARTARVSVTPGLGGPGGTTLVARVSVDEVLMTLPAEMQLRIHPATWAVDRKRTIALESPGAGLTLSGGTGARGPFLDVRAAQLNLDPLVTFEIEGIPARELGILDGWLHAEGDPRRDFQGQVRGSLLDGRGTLNLVVTPVKSETRLEILTTLEAFDFARVFGALGLEGSPPPGELGLLSGNISASGPLGDPGSLDVIEGLDFKPPRRRPSSVTRLRDDFIHQVTTNQGAQKRIEVSPESPDFIALPDVPPLFIRALLIAEDGAFFSHPGVDLTEVPKAIATNWARGESVRGASTITQQLAKNLFLTREKSLHRKLKELSYAFLLESTLGKVRILEIYLNIIEWGPGLYGLKPAARHYFGKEPSDLTPKEVAFLVSLIPGPIKYQRSIQGDELGPGFDNLVNNLLVKLRSVDALTEEEYEAAREEKLLFRWTNTDTDESVTSPAIQKSQDQ